LADTRLKIAVFIDFDNIEIGVKNTLGVQFDIGVVLEALKERGDVVSKIAYGDWTRAGDYSRSLTPRSSCSAISHRAATRTAPTSTSPSTRSRWRSPTATSTPT
jgi:hypothetical protein